jgi:cobyrinic acid a,c-diamide synthase
MIYNGVELRGYEFHYSATNNAENSLIATQATNIKGTNVDLPLYRYKNIIASYGHWYWGDKDILDLWK